MIVDKHSFWLSRVILPFVLFIFTLLTAIGVFFSAAQASDLVITEIKSHAPTNQGKPALITKVNITNNSSWFEVYNPWETSVQLKAFSISSEKIKSFSLDLERLSPGEYFYVCNTQLCPSFKVKNQSDSQVHNFNFKKTDEIKITSINVKNKSSRKSDVQFDLNLKRSRIPRGNPDGVLDSDEVSWFTAQDRKRGLSSVKSISVELNGSNFLERKTGPNNCLQDTQVSKLDFNKGNKKSSSRKYKLCDELYPQDPYEYIEIYNASENVINPVKDGYKIADSLDKKGSEEENWYKIISHPNFSVSNPFMTGESLAPGQVGLILPPAADTFVLYGLYELKSNFNIQSSQFGQVQKQYLNEKFGNKKPVLYTTKSMSDDTIFFTDGLHNKIMEEFKFYRPDAVPPEIHVPSGDSPWKPLKVRPNVSRVKIDPEGSNTSSNWKLERGGSPGKVK